MKYVTIKENPTDQNIGQTNTAKKKGLNYFKTNSKIEFIAIMTD